MADAERFTEFLKRRKGLYLPKSEASRIARATSSNKANASAFWEGEG
jgi:hypothetical protein